MIVIAIVFAGGGFYGGLSYEKNQALSPSFFQSLSAAQRQQAFGQNAGGAGGRFRGAGGAAGGGFTRGKILSQDDKSITVQLADGSSKIIFFSGSTQILKSDTGQKADLAVGKQVSVSGTTGSDGTITASSISIQNIPPAANPAQNNPSTNK